MLRESNWIVASSSSKMRSSFGVPTVIRKQSRKSGVSK
jgi:hypothetical protein